MQLSRSIGIALVAAMVALSACSDDTQPMGGDAGHGGGAGRGGGRGGMGGADGPVQDGGPDAPPATLVGTVQDLDGDPLPDVTLAIGGAMAASLAPAGDFAVAGARAGSDELTIDARMASVRGRSFSRIVERLRPTLAPTERRVLPRPIYLTPLSPPIDLSGQVSPMGPEATIESPAGPGLSIEFPTGTTVSFPQGAPPSISVTGIPFDRTPIPLDGYGAPLVVVLEPSGLTVSLPVPVHFPNSSRIPLGTRLEVWSLDHTSGTLGRIGTGDHGDAEVVPLHGRSGKSALGGAQLPGDTEIRTDEGAGIRGFSLKIPVCRATTVRGRVVDPAGLPLPGVDVSVKTPSVVDPATDARAEGEVPGASTLSGADGTFAIAGVRACQLRVEALLMRTGDVAGGRTEELGTHGPADTDVGDVVMDTATPLVKTDVAVHAQSAVGTPLPGLPVQLSPCYGACASRTNGGGEAAMRDVYLPQGGQVTAEAIGGCLEPARGMAPRQPGGMLLLSFSDMRQATPAIGALKPFSAVVGGGAQPIAIVGDGLFPSSKIRFGQTTLEATLVTCNTLVATVPQGALGTPGNVEVRVENPTGLVSAPAQFEVVGLAGQVSVISQMMPDHGPPGTLITLTGSAFGTGQGHGSVTFAGAMAPRVMSWGETSIQVEVPPTAQTGLVQLATPGGLAESPNVFRVESNPRPIVSSIEPSEVASGSPDLAVRLRGAGFLAATTVSVSGTQVAVRMTSSQLLDITVPASLLGSAGPLAIVATNPAPGGGASSPATLNVVTANPRPVLTALSPTSIPAGAASVILHVTGTGFVDGASLRFGSTTVWTVLTDASHLVAEVPGALLATPGAVQVTVENPAPGGGASNALPFSVGQPLPVVSAIAPASARAGGPDLVLQIMGQSFAPGAVVRFAGTALPTTFGDATRLDATLPAALTATPGVFDLVVAVPGVGESAPTPFVVGDPVPTITTLLPSRATSEGPAFSLTVTGTGFVPSAVVRFGAAALATTRSSDTQLVAMVPAGELSAARTVQVTVANATDNVSAPSAFSIADPTPSIATLTPASAAVESPATALTVNGAGFFSHSVVQAGGMVLPTTVVSTTRLATSIPATQLQTAGPLAITVSNGIGNVSMPISFQVTLPVPTLTNLSRTSAVAGSAGFSLTLTGGNFLQRTVVHFGATTLTPTTRTATSLVVAVPTSALATAGTQQVVASNGTGADSNAVGFDVQNAQPTITALTPSTLPAGSAMATLNVGGTGFVSGATVQFGTMAAATTFRSATQLDATLTPAMLANAGTVTVTATNPSPSAGPSAGATFSITNPVPTVSDLAPRSAPAAAAAMVTLTGGGLNAQSVVVELTTNTRLATTLLSPMQVRATVTAALMANVGELRLQVQNPAPGGGSSAAVRFSVSGWQRLAPGGTSPPPGLSGAAVAATGGGRVYIFGGRTNPADPTTAQRTMYAFDSKTNAWMGSVPQPPATMDPRWKSGMAWDAFHQSMFVYGGEATSPNGAYYVGDQWSFDERSWAFVTQSMTAPGPWPRRSPNVAYDAARRVIIVHSGDSSDGPIAEAFSWHWNGTRWAQVGNANQGYVTGGLAGGTISCDDRRASCVLFGGNTRITTVLTNNSYDYDGQIGWKGPTTTPAFAPTNPPGARWQLCGMGDTTRNVHTVFGGADAMGTLLAETWTLDWQSWMREGVASPSPRGWAGCSFDAGLRGGTGVLYGGQTGATATSNELWAHVPADTDECLLPTSLGRSVSVTVDARLSGSTSFIDSGITLGACHAYRVRVTGGQTVGACSGTGCPGAASADGLPQDLRQFTCQPYSMWCGALIGTVSAANPGVRAPVPGMFVNGTDRSSTTLAAGNLWFKVDDIDGGENTGAYTLTIDY